jgi:inorganic pyrophosphatase
MAAGRDYTCLYPLPARFHNTSRFFFLARVTWAASVLTGDPMTHVFRIALLLCGAVLIGMAGLEVATSQEPSARLILANGPGPLAEGATQVDPLTIRGAKNLYNGYPARNADHTINVVVEIPAGTSSKWEVNSEGVMVLEVREAAPRVVAFLPYPGNYGMIPNTKLPKEDGGDGDALDVLILGPALPRGTVAKVHVIGVMKFLDKGEQDDKILAVMDDTPMAKVRSLKELNESFPGVSEIVHLWFTKYKGPNKMVFKGWGEAKEATELVTRAIAAAKK